MVTKSGSAFIGILIFRRFSRVRGIGGGSPTFSAVPASQRAARDKVAERNEFTGEKAIHRESGRGSSEPLSRHLTSAL